MFEYVKQYYGKDLFIGQGVEYKGRPGIITEDRGHYVGITLDDEKPYTVNSFHPNTEGLVYLDIKKKIRKITRSQAIS